MSDIDLSLDQSEPKYDFDYHALSKLKRLQRQKTICFSTLTILLVLLMVIFVVLYVNCKKHDHGNTIKNISLEQTRISAYAEIAKHGEDCSKDFKCGKHAFCRYLQGTYRCDCMHGFYGDGIGDCRNGYFGIRFQKETTKNLPTVSDVAFPASDALSVCFWVYVAEAVTGKKAVFTYISHLVKGEDSLMVWVKKNNIFSVSFKGTEIVLNKGAPMFKTKQWTHVCWMWNYRSSWNLYLNGNHYTQGKSVSKEANAKFPRSKGDILLGQDLDDGHINDPKEMFKGELTEMFIYSRELKQQEVTAAYQNVPATKDAVLGWWQFKNTVNGSDIIETSYPFVHKYFKSKRK